MEVNQTIEDGLKQGLSKSDIARLIVNDYPGKSLDSRRKIVYKYIEDSIQSVNETDTVTETNQYEASSVLSARKPDGGIMTPREYCETYGLDYSDVKSYKLVTHTGVPFYNIASRNMDEVESMSPQELKDIIEEELSKYQYSPKPVESREKVIAVKIADIHFGAYIDGLIRTRDYSIRILADKLNEAADIINEQGASEVHIHLLGDLIESFTGLNHKNSWKGLQKGMIGAEAVKLCCKVLHKDFLGRINNLDSIKLVAGNHDRLTSNKDEDTDGGAADLIAWGLSLMGYDVQFDPLVVTHVLDGICHILMHGDKPVSKKSTKDICWDYGKQDMFNLVCEGHLHSIIERLSISQKTTFQTVKDDAVDHRRMICPSLFTGNSFSENLGYTSNSGFVITENNGKGIPNVYYYAI